MKRLLKNVNCYSRTKIFDAYQIIGTLTNSPYQNLQYQQQRHRTLAVNRCRFAFLSVRRNDTLDLDARPITTAVLCHIATKNALHWWNKCEKFGAAATQHGCRLITVVSLHCNFFLAKLRQSTLLTCVSSRCMYFHRLLHFFNSCCTATEHITVVALTWQGLCVVIAFTKESHWTAC